MKHIVFSDIDGTLLTDEHKITEKTQEAIRKLKEQDIPFVIVSARSPSGIYPLLEDYNLKCPIISHSGGAIFDENKKVLYHTGMSKDIAKEMISFIEEEKFDLAWGVYTLTQWIVKDKSDPRVINEERVVQAQTIQGDVDTAEGEEINKILCICNPDQILEIEEKMKKRFPGYSIAKSSDVLLEVMPGDINKAAAVERVCELYGVDIKNAVAFGDNYNDEQMLQTAGKGFLMANAPTELKTRIAHHAKSNNESGIYYALKDLKLVN